ncbi:MAG: hypothetical protein WCK81_00695 [Betaproteobacteria bacterium]
MSSILHQARSAQHLEAAAHPPRAAYASPMAHTALLVSHQAHVPHGQKLYAVQHQSHPAQHLALPALQEPQE